MARKVGIDYGNARIGVAISDETQILASPIDTLQSGKDMNRSIEALLQAIKTYEPIDEIIIGLPLLMSGKDSDMTKTVRSFAEKLEALSGKTVTLWDERLTSLQVHRALKEQSFNRKKRAKMIDKLSATLILQSYLDAKGNAL